MAALTTMIDWDLAVSTASRLAGPGPSIDRDQAESVVAELRAGAARSTPLVRDFTGLVAQERSAPILVVDRAGWIRANADGFARIITPLADRLRAKRKGTSGVGDAVGSKVTGLEVGALLGFMSSKVLGQFDPFWAPSGAPEAGRLLLVAPNIVDVERQLGVDPADFRLWVCLHEETHRVQFTAVPWLRDHIQSEIEGLVGEVDLDPSRMAALLGEAVKRLGDVVRGEEGASLIDLLSTPKQQETMERLTGVMSLLEGHADVVMDGVGPEVIASVAEIRRKFNQRRKGAGYVDRLLRRLLGLEAKMAQYRDGAAFVRTVVDRVGMVGFNRVWTSPETLPSKAEILDPELWLSRVHGPPQLDA
ncbi:MAG: zinc-dependent metalloprotease [Nocardioidaceae bacterium]